ncbi:MAG: hypothetical protein AVDCRST_MAG20-338, partial [uncultured Acidimicrobiales bacterium]
GVARRRRRHPHTHRPRGTRLPTAHRPRSTAAALLKQDGRVL